MALDDTYLNLEINTSHAYYTGLHTVQQRALVLMCGKGGAAAVHHAAGNRTRQAHYAGLAGYSSRLVGDSKSLAIGRGGLRMPLSQLWSLNRRTVEDLAEYVGNGTSGIITARLLNRGRTVTGAATAANAFMEAIGPKLTGQEIARQYIEPRLLWDGVVANQAAPAASADQFLYLPRLAGSKLVIDIEFQVGADSCTLTVYSYNPTTNTVLAVYSATGIASSMRIELDSLPPWVLPRITAGLAASTLDISVGTSPLRLS